MSILQVWEDENGEDFLVYGERYLDVLERLARVEKAPPARNVFLLPRDRLTSLAC